VRQAEETLRAKLRSALAETSKYRLTDLLNASATNGGGSKLGELEKNILESLNGSQAASGVLASSGIEAVSVGIESMELPQAVTEAVFRSMQATQEKIAGAEAQRGATEAASIKAKAESQAKQILAFGERGAEGIRAQGAQESAQYLAMQKDDPRLAVFLQQLRFLRESQGGKRTTLVLPLSMAGFQLFDPGVQEKLRQGIIPQVGVEQGAMPKVEAPRQPAERESANQPSEGGKR
jgi:membrane protease subunit HflC